MGHPRSDLRRTAPPPAAEAGSLQDRKQRLMRADIASRATNLLLERGFDAVTIEDLARAAGISRRTFFRYFATKEAVVTSALQDIGGILLAEFRARPRREHPLTSLRIALGTAIQQFADDRVRSRAMMRLIRETPSLRSQFLFEQDEWADRLTSVVSERLSRDANSFMLARLIARVSIVTADAAITSWAEGDHRDLGPVIDQAFEALDALVRAGALASRER